MNGNVAAVRTEGREVPDETGAVDRARPLSSVASTSDFILRTLRSR